MVEALLDEVELVRFEVDQFIKEQARQRIAELAALVKNGGTIPIPIEVEPL